MTGVFSVVHSFAVKKCSLSLMIGPPNEKPVCERLNGCRATAAVVARRSPDSGSTWKAEPWQLVGAALRDGVEEQAAEVALAHVERREQHLELLDRLDGDRLGADFGARLAGGAETEDVTLGGAVDLHVVHAVRHSARREAGPVVETCGASLTKSVTLRDVVGTRRRTVSEMVVRVPVWSG